MDMTKQAPRKRASVKNGYKKTTITVPMTVHKQFQAYIKKNPGLSMSAFLTEAGQYFLENH